MRKILSLAIAFVMALSLAITVCAEPYTAGTHVGCSDICGLTGDHVNQVNLTCKKCHIRTVTVYCAGGDYDIPNAACFESSHTRPCEVVDRHAGVADAYCSYCGSYFFDAFDFRVWDFDGHVDRCTHTSTGIEYKTCNYGPREYY